jgi:hypothetical protein
MRPDGRLESHTLALMAIRRARRLSFVEEFRRRLGMIRRYLLRETTSGRRNGRTLASITAAEARLDAGVFGLCEACGGPIALARLRESPTARRCARCAARRRGAQR